MKNCAVGRVVVVGAEAGFLLFIHIVQSSNSALLIVIKILSHPDETRDTEHLLNLAGKTDPGPVPADEG